MNDRKREILNASERIDFYDEANPQLATELAVTVELFAANKTNITRLHEAGITSDTSSAAGKSSTRSKVARSRQIQSDLRRVARTARLIEKKVAGFQNTFDVPRGGLSYQELIDKANAFIVNHVANKTHFAKYGLNDAFFEELQADVTELGEASEGQADAKRTGVGVTADSEAALEDTLEVRGELKIAIENHYKNNPQKLAEWLTASHIKRRGETETPPTPPPVG
jgi:hypothetical protein